MSWIVWRRFHFSTPWNWNDCRVVRRISPLAYLCVSASNCSHCWGVTMPPAARMRTMKSKAGSNRCRDRCKILYWDRDGLVVWAKRLERGRFQIPGGGDAASPTIEVDAVTLAMMIELESTGIKVNLVSPAFTKTNLNNYAGTESVEDGSREVVRVALLGPDGPTGTFTRWENETIPW